ncbi:unnamed protein product [Adineta steineri]|uniref:C-type lectin domain-containing protein n=1 Tax=Adineta steineri TaxID=433720 RepID=A0A815AP72_9BILA|nr:unnamed protein product [Adineta steineri]
MLRFMFQFIFILNYIFNLIQADNLSSRNQCHSNWHYISEESLCIIFATSQAGDVSWYDSSKACQTSSTQLLTLTNSKKIQLIQEKVNHLENNNQIGFDYFQHGAWIEKTKWSKYDLCDDNTTDIINEDFQLNCIILTIRSNDQSLCLKRVSCEEHHPFICENEAITERELVESTMERLTWWKCIIALWCILDHEAEKRKKEQQALAAQAAEAASLQAYIEQFNFEIPDDVGINADAQALMESNGNGAMLFGYSIPFWALVAIGGFLFLFIICLCCTVLICIFMKIKNGQSRHNPAYRDVRAFNETCGTDKPPCSEPLKCISGYCLCSNIAQTTDENNPLSFWTGEECMTCPFGYTTTGTKCYNLILGKDTQSTWERARERCKEHGGDLLVLRSDQEYKSIIAILKYKYASLMFNMYQRVPQDGAYFGSIWLGAMLTDWRGDGTFKLVSHGPSFTKKSQYWCSKSSPLGHEPNYVQLKVTGERQACIGLAFFHDGNVCMHDWFCSWESHTLCEIHPPPPPAIETSEVEALEEKSSNTWLFVGIGGIFLLLLSGSICACYFLCNKKNGRRRARSFDSAETGMSQNSFY